MINKPVGTSYLRTPINSSVMFNQPRPDYLLPGYDFSENGFLILNDVLVTVSQNKDIVKTSLVRPQGSTLNPEADQNLSRYHNYAGTVKEYISMGDFTITLRGELVGEDINDYPAEKAERLKMYLNYPGSFQISGKFINMFDFTEVVVESYSISEREGFSTSIPFTISLISDDLLQVKYATVETSGYTGVDLVGTPSNTA